jgi:hypothetical protein
MVDPAQGLGSGFWLGHRVARVNSDFKKIKWRRFSKKKTKFNGLQPSFWPGRRVTLGFDFLYFFLKPGPVPAPGRPVRSGRILKLWFWAWKQTRSMSFGSGILTSVEMLGMDVSLTLLSLCYHPVFGNLNMDLG